MKKLVLFLCMFTLCLGLLGCNDALTSKNVADAPQELQEPKEKEAEKRPENQIAIAALNGPTGMGMAKMIQNAINGEVGEFEYSIQMKSSIDEVTPMVIKGEIDIAAVPANMASILYNKTEKDVTVLAINTLGVLYICEKGDTVNSVADLKGKTIYASGKGATPEYALNYILEKNGLKVGKDVEIKWKSEHAECVTALSTDEDGIALLPQPFVTTAQMKDSDIRIALDLTKEWDALQTGEEQPSALLTGVVIVRNEYLEKHPDGVQQFMKDYEASIQYVNSNVEEAGELIGEFGIIDARVAKKAIPQCNITFITGAEMKEKLSGYLTVLAEQNKKAVGGELPDESFYYQS